MKLFVDVNVIVSVLNKEYPLFTFSSRILSLNDYQHYKLYTSPVCLAIAFYFSEKKSGYKIARKKLEILCNHIHISGVGSNEISKTLSNKKINDIEDGIEYYSALNSGCKCIITEDKDDFYFSEVEVLSSENFLKKYF